MPKRARIDILGQLSGDIQGDSGGLDYAGFLMYTVNTRFEWNDKKAEQNTLKHGISFEMAAFAFDDPYALIIDDEKHSAEEYRQWLIGDSGKKVLVIVFTMRLPRGHIRIVSARRANRRERRLYEENKGI